MLAGEGTNVEVSPSGVNGGANSSSSMATISDAPDGSVDEAPPPGFDAIADNVGAAAVPVNEAEVDGDDVDGDVPREDPEPASLYLAATNTRFS